MMKNIIFTTSVAISIALCTYGQQPPTTGNSNLEKTPTTGNSNINNQNAWSRAGNSQLNGGKYFWNPLELGLSYKTSVWIPA